ncbi:hypothetical protein V6N12_053812 [Hibiscus sabdariffa]|uniref:RNase H type-1 domain-containing protein n=1 Tax=Hibiscus sabdariffa TaxID=183260 RepID=A0ABR2D8P5_9ROSI
MVTVISYHRFYHRLSLNKLLLSLPHKTAMVPIRWVGVGATTDLDHILRRCLQARNLWTRVVPSDHLAIFLNLPFKNWLRHNLLHRQFSSSFADGWDCQFAVFCWLLWKDRCTTIIDSENTPTEDILTRGFRLAAECNYVFAGTPRQNSPAMVPQSWSRPPMGWVKANVDASVNLADGKAAIGCAIRNEQALGWSSSSNGLSLPFPPADLISLIEEEKVRSTCELLSPEDWSTVTNVACFNLHIDSGG